jgi:hypothetical protein
MVTASNDSDIQVNRHAFFARKCNIPNNHNDRSFSQEEAPKWPQDYYVCDILAVFKQPPHGILKKTAFERHFPSMEFKKSIFYDNYNLWK